MMLSQNHSACWTAHACRAKSTAICLLASTRNTHTYTFALFSAGQDTVAALAQCLEARREQPCPDTNDLALNALDCLHKVAPRLQLAGLPSQLLWQLLSEVCHSMMTHDTPLRVRGTAAGVVQRLAQETQNLGSLAEAAGMCLPMQWTLYTFHSWTACSCSQRSTLHCEMHALSLSEIQPGYQRLEC